MNFKDKFSRRIFFICAVFVIVSLVYILKMINIASTPSSDRIITDTYERREPIQAVRGEIYDRNGKKLVANSYTYDLVLDYDAMAATHLERNYDILTLLSAVSTTGNTDNRVESSFPFDGTYPDYTYSEQARDTDSDIYYRLLRRIAQNELESDSEKEKTELTASYLADFYSKNPDEFPTEKEIVDWYLDRYSISSTDKNGDPLFNDAQIDKLIRERYDMEVADFSIYNRYTVAKAVDMNTIVFIEELCIPGVEFVKQSERVYTYAGYASHILGLVGSIPSESWDEYKAQGYKINDTVGLSGCESIFEQYLRGIDGVRVITEDKNGNIIDSRIETQPISGKDVYLTIDIDLQIAAEEGLRENVNLIGDAQAGGLSAIDPKSGEVLALASYPSYDLGTYNKDYDNLLKDPAKPLYNRALDGLYTPGSTFKVGMVAAGISCGCVSSSSRLDCNGIYTYFDDYQPECWYYPNSHGKINAAYALQVSCNCYFYELGRIMGIDTMNQYCSAFGLGSHTGIELQEKIGMLAGPAYRDENGLLAWNTGDTIQAAIGQSNNQFTPLQIANYIATVTNGGTRYSLHILKEVKEYGSGKVIYTNAPKIADSVHLSEDALYAVRQGMKQMVEQDAAASKYMQGLPVTVGGKTGTAERGNGKNDNRLFVCAAPYNNPDIVISVAIEPTDEVPKDNLHGSSHASYAASVVLKEFYK